MKDFTKGCRDAGFDCDAVMRAETEAEVLQQAAEHAKTVHNLSEISEQAFARQSRAGDAINLPGAKIFSAGRATQNFDAHSQQESIL